MRAGAALACAALAAAAVLGGCDRSDAASQGSGATVSEHDVSDAGVPPGWVRHAFGGARGFSLAMPADMEALPAEPLDSLVGRFRSRSLQLDFDYGWYSDPLDRYHPGNASIEAITIDKRDARLVTTADTVAVHVPVVHGQTRLTVHLALLDPSAAATARRIIESIRFASAR